MSTVVGLFDKLSTAETVVDELGKKGFTRYEISLVANAKNDEYRDYFSPIDGSIERSLTTGEGTGAGAMAGVVTGLIVGLVGFVVPGIGPLIAAGPLVAALTGGTVGIVAGAATGGLVAGLIQSDVPEDEAKIYANSILAGGALVVVRTSEDVTAAARQVMRDFGALDVVQRQADPSTFEPIGTAMPSSLPDSVSDYSQSPSVADKTFAAIEPACQEHFARYYANRTGITYGGMRPFYRYGFNLATDRRYASANWDQVETEARSLWEMRNSNDTWDSYVDAVRFGWECVRRAGNMQPQEVTTYSANVNPIMGLSEASA